MLTHSPLTLPSSKILSSSMVNQDRICGIKGSAGVSDSACVRRGIGSSCNVVTPLVLPLLWIGLMNVSLERCGIQQDNALLELNDAVVTNDCIMDSNYTQYGNSTVKGADEEDPERVINELRRRLVLRNKMMTMSGDIIFSLEKQHKYQSQLLEAGKITDFDHTDLMEPTVVVQHLWIQLMNNSLQLCGVQQDNALQELNEAIVTNNCIIDPIDTQDGNSTVKGADEEDQERVIDELRGLHLLTKEMMKMASKRINTLKKENEEQRDLYYDRLRKDSAGLSASESVVHMLLRNLDAISELYSVTEEDISEI